MLNQTWTVLALTVAVAATACGGGSGASKKPSAPAAVQHPKSLVGVVGHNDAFSISLSDEAGNAISNLAAGTYSLTIKDESTMSASARCPTFFAGALK